MMGRTMQRSLLLVALATLAVFLQGCVFGSESQNCNGDACGCTLTFHSFWARVRVSGVPIEHASGSYSFPNVANNTENASVSPCCDAIYDQIDYDEGKSPSTPNKAIDSFASSCANSPNPEIAAAATKTSSGDGVSVLAVRRLRAPTLSLAAQRMPSQRTSEDNLGYQPVDDGEVGQDCYLDVSRGFKLNNAPISSGSMKLRIRWVDPDGGNTTCCDALQPVLSHVYIDRRSESDLPKKIKDSFCRSCRWSNNRDIALAAYRCFGEEMNATFVA